MFTRTSLTLWRSQPWSSEELYALFEAQIEGLALAGCPRAGILPFTHNDPQSEHLPFRDRLVRRASIHHALAPLPFILMVPADLWSLYNQFEVANELVGGSVLDRDVVRWLDEQLRPPYALMGVAGQVAPSANFQLQPGRNYAEGRKRVGCSIAELIAICVVVPALAVFDVPLVAPGSVLSGPDVFNKKVPLLSRDGLTGLNGDDGTDVCVFTCDSQVMHTSVV